MIRFFLALLILASDTTFASAAAKTGKDCASLKDDTARLLCYDLIFRATAKTTKPADSKWVVREERSKIDDSRKVFLHVNSMQSHRNRYGRSEDLTVYIACRENVTSLWIYFAGEFMAGTGNTVPVTIRVDKNKAETKRFSESNNHTALGLWSGGSAIPFIKSLFGGDTLLVRATPYSESSVTAEFPITGLEEAIKPLREACNW